MTILTRPLGLTQTRQLLTFPANGYEPTVTAYLWGGGGGAGGSDGPRLGGAGTGGGFVRADFTVAPGDTIEITVGSAGFSGRTSNTATNTATAIFNTRTELPNGSTTAPPKASSTYVSRWSAFLNQTSVWNTGTAVDGTVTDLSRTLTFDQTYTVNFPFSIDYLFTLAAYYQATVYLDGVELFSSGLNSWITQETFGVPFTSNIIAGLHTVRIVATAPPGAQYGNFGVGLTIFSTASAGSGGGGLNRTIFDTRNTPASPPLTIPDINILIDSGKSGSFSNLMNDFGMWESNPTAASCARSYSVYFPYTAYYTLEMCAANTATLSIDGAAIFTTPGTISYTTSYTTDILVSQGTHTVAFSAALSDPTIIGGVAIKITKSWSGATGGQAGTSGSSGGGGGSGGATTLVLNPGTINETLLAVAVGGAGGGGAGASTAGQGQSTAPGPRGLSAAGKSNGQLGENQGLFYKDGGGGGGGGPGGPTGAGNNGFSGVGDSYGQAGALGVSYRDTSATTGGIVIEPSGINTGGTTSEYYSLVPDSGVGANPGQPRGQQGAAVFVVDAYGIQVRDDAIDGTWKDVKTAFVNVDGIWRQTFAAFIYQNNVWQMVIGGAALTFAGATTDYGVISRPSDYRPAPPPPPPPVIYDSQSVRTSGGQISTTNSSIGYGTPSNSSASSSTSASSGCFVPGTMVAMADGSVKQIEDVVIGDQLIGKDGTINTVLEYIRPVLGSRSLISFNNGVPFITDDHPVLMTDGSWKSVDPDATLSKYAKLTDRNITQLTVGDVVATADGAGFAITSIEYHAASADLQLYNFALDGNHTYVANNLVVHNKSASAGGGGCFVGTTLVTMSDGTSKPICDVKIGDLVANFDGTQINQVLFVEQATDTSFGFLYSPDHTHAPFATANHPLYINGRLSSLDPEKTSNIYPWIEQTELLETTNMVPADGSTVYNLWTDGDHTFIVNGYGTTTLAGDGGVLRLIFEQGLISASRASELIVKFHGLNKHTVYGLYTLSNILGKINVGPVNKLTAWVFADDSRPRAKQVFYNIAQVVGVAVCLFKRR